MTRPAVHRVPLRGVPIAVRDTGPPPGNPGAATVVFGHGLLFDGTMFDPQVDHLRDRYRCVTLDWRGQGATPPTRGGYDMDELTGDALALIGHLDVGPVHWVGLSMGGFVGQRLAARHAAVLASLTLLSTSATGEDVRDARERRLLAYAQLVTGFGAVRSRVEPLVFGPAFRADPASRPVRDGWAARLTRLGRRARRDAVLGVTDRAPVLDELPGISTPTLVVVGADDVATPPEQSRRIAAAIPGARLHVLPDCGHTCTLERPEPVARLIAEHLAATTPAAPGGSS